MGNPYPVLDYVRELPLTVPALERPTTQGVYVAPIIPKRSKYRGPSPIGPAEATYYFPVAKFACNPTGVFFPSGYSFPAEMDVILYFHGFKQGKFSHINEYWSGRLMGIRLREDVNASGRRPVLIAPTLGERPGGRNTGDMRVFGRPGGGDDFLAEVVRWIGKSVPEYTSRGVTPTVRKVILAGHSGAGVILDAQAWSMTTPIREVWGFDSLYGGQDRAVASWLSLARMRPNLSFFFHWGTSPLGGNATELGGLASGDLPNITVEKSDALPGEEADSNAHHFSVMTANFPKRLKAARWS